MTLEVLVFGDIPSGFQIAKDFFTFVTGLQEDVLPVVISALLVYMQRFQFQWQIEFRKSCIQAFSRSLSFTITDNLTECLYILTTSGLEETRTSRK